MKILPKILNYYSQGTTFYRVSYVTHRITKYKVVNANLEERADIDEMPRLVYIIEREDGKMFSVSEEYINNSFDDMDVAKLAVEDDRSCPESFETPQKSHVADIAAILKTEYGVLDEHIKDYGDYLIVFGWNENNGEYKQEPISCDFDIGERVIIYFGRTYYKTKEDCQAEEFSDFFVLYIKDALVQSIYDGIDRKKYGENVPSDTLWMLSEDFIKYWQGMHYIFSDITYTDAKTCALIQLAYNEAKKTLEFNDIHVLD